MVDKEGLDYYEVGGAPRDRIMGREPNDYDYVVVGASREEMIQRGFLRIESADFPIFLDKDSADEGEMGDEYALARTEQKEGDGEGYTSFDWCVENVNLKEDLRRRDFTINAMARDPETGEIIDPFGGKEDIERGVIRHVSEAFSDDPLRIIRMARFASRFDFDVSEETMELAQGISDEIEAVDNTRLIREFIKAMKQAEKPSKFFRLCEEAGVFEHFLPVVDEMTKIPAGPPKYHKEGTVFEHSLMVTDELHKLRGNRPMELLGAFFHDVGKVRTYDEESPYEHYGHAKEGVKVIDDIDEKIGLRKDLYRYLTAACREHMKIKRLSRMNNNKIIPLLNKYYQNEGSANIEFIVELGLADSRGRIPQGDFEHGKAIDIVEKGKIAVDMINGDYLQERHDDFLNWEGEKRGQVVKSHYVEELAKLR